MRSAEERRASIDARRARRDDTRAAKAAEPVIRPSARFDALGVQIMDTGDVHTFNGFGGTGRRLGPAAGAIAEVGAERRRHRVAGAAASTLALGPLGLLGAAGKKAKASAFITLADGTFHEHKLDGNGAVTRGHRQAAAFNAAVTGLG